LFNVATAFGRGDKDGDTILGGASMAPHPFTTIDPNIGYCLVPAPPGSCPEDSITQAAAAAGTDSMMGYGSTHGRDANGRRFLPVLLKDVAGLVPGAYQGRGRGNQFLNDLCDANVLIHVVDASGTADAQGNAVILPTCGEEEEDEDAPDPLDDLAWIRNELVEWVYTNIMVKWDSIRRKGRSKVWEVVRKMSCLVVVLKPGSDAVNSLVRVAIRYV
jgi:ribosome-binding ATPase YchF (GTP1/OBG family)